ncbi:jg21003, partial [Pararge aegeria aegeria]
SCFQAWSVFCRSLLLPRFNFCLSYKLRPPKNKPKILMRRNFGGMDVNRLCDDARKIDWSAVGSASCINLKVDIFCSLLTQLYNVHAPIKAVKIKHLPAPWLTDELKNRILKKNIAKSKFKINNSDENRRKYHEVRNRCNTLCRDAQRRHIHTSVENGNSSKVWKFLETVGVGKSSVNSTPPSVDIELLNQYFSTPSNSFGSSDKLHTLHALSAIPTPNYPPFEFSQFTVCDVKKNILTIASNAVGCDDISRNMLIPLLDVITPVITHILNECTSTSKFPDAWKSAHVIPLPKRAIPADF